MDTEKTHLILSWSEATFCGLRMVNEGRWGPLLSTNPDNVTCRSCIKSANSRVATKLPKGAA